MKWTYCNRQAEQKCSCGQQLGLLFLLVLLVLSVAWTGRKDQLLVYQTHTVTSENETFMLEGDMPAGATVKAEKIGSGIYDLSILDVNGQEYQPGEHPVKVTIVQKTACRVYHLEETGWFELDTQLTEQGLSFQAVHFSLYAITMDAMLLSSDEMEEAVLSGTEVPIYFSWNGQTYDAQTFGSMLQTSIPLSVKSGHIEEHLDHLSQVLQGGCLDEQTLSEEPIVGAWLEGASGELLMQVHQVFSVRGHVFYDPSELREEDYIGEEETVSAVRYSLASEISGRNYELQSGERIVLKLAVTSQTVQVSEMTERSIHSVLGSGMADASLTLGSDLTILVKDAQTDESVQASFVLLSMEGEQLWSSSSVASQHTIDSGAVNFQAGETYILRQTQTANGYSCPGFDWTLTVGDDNVISGTSQTQEGSGKARSLGLQSVNGCFEVRNEQTPTLILHLQDRWDEQGETLKTLNLLAGDLDTTYTGMETRASYWFLGWSSSAQSLTVQYLFCSC